MGRGVVWHAGPIDCPVPSTWGEWAGSMGEQAGPSQRESEREQGPHTTRCSSELERFPVRLKYHLFLFISEYDKSLSIMYVL